QPHKPDPPKNVFQAQYSSAGKKLGQRLFDELAKSGSLKPRLTVATALAFVVAALVHLLTLALGVFGISSLFGALSDPPAALSGLFYLGIAWFLRPRVPRIDKEYEAYAVSRQEFPGLYKVADDVAR